MSFAKNTSDSKNPKKVESTGDLIGNKIADKITNFSKQLHPKSISYNMYSYLNYQQQSRLNEINEN